MGEIEPAKSSTCGCGMPESQCVKGDLDVCPYIDDPVHDEEDDELTAGDECGRWSNGKLTRSCAKAGSEECDFECPYRGSLYG